MNKLLHHILIRRCDSRFYKYKPIFFSVAFLQLVSHPFFLPPNIFIHFKLYQAVPANSFHYIILSLSLSLLSIINSMVRLQTSLLAITLVLSSALASSNNYQRYKYSQLLTQCRLLILLVPKTRIACPPPTSWVPKRERPIRTWLGLRRFWYSRSSGVQSVSILYTYL